MKVLFVCRGNIGISQITQALYNKYLKKESFSAGNKVFEKKV